jgi:hypothetical protein
VRLGVIPGSPRPISFVSLGWEVVQSVVHQPLELTILVRVQASQPNLAAMKGLESSRYKRPA